MGPTVLPRHLPTGCTGSPTVPPEGGSKGLLLVSMFLKYDSVTAT